MRAIITLGQDVQICGQLLAHLAAMLDLQAEGRKCGDPSDGVGQLLASLTAVDRLCHCSLCPIESSLVYIVLLS